MSVFDVIIGQELAVQEFRNAVHEAQNTDLDAQGNAMTHAWLITGPPGSGRSTLALSFAAALLCKQHGCGTCEDCRSVLAGVHPDIEHVIPEGVSYSIKDTFALIERAALLPTKSPWHVIVVEDVDRFLVDAASVLLKSIEEPPLQTVWILCAPTAEDVVETIKSRCRHVSLTTPPLSAITEQLIARYGIDEKVAEFAARVSQGHIGRARALATDEQARKRRREVLEIPAKLTSVSSCFSAAEQLIKVANADADAMMDEILAHDESRLAVMYGDSSEIKGMKSTDRHRKAAMKANEARHKIIRRRVLADQYNRALSDLIGFYRDVLIVQAGSDAQLIHEDLHDAVHRVAEYGDSASMLLRIDAVRETADQLLANVAPLAAFESLFMMLRDPQLVRVHV